MSYLEEQAEKLSEITEIPSKEILGEFENKVKEGYSDRGAVMVWKSQHKRQLGSGESGTFVGRVIGKGEPRQGDYGEYVYDGLLTYNDGIIEAKTMTFSGEGMAKREMLELGKVYELKAFEKQDGTLTRIRAIKESEDKKVPQVCELGGYDFAFKPLNDLRKFVGESHVL